MEVERNQCLAFSVTATANEPRNVKAGMAIHHKCIYTSSCKHLLHAEHHNCLARSTVYNVHTWGTVLVNRQFTHPAASLDREEL
jgi:hypothetical protein